MVDLEVAEDGIVTLAHAIRQILDDARSRTVELPQNGFQRRMRFSALVAASHDVSTLALAAVVLIRRSRQDLEPV